MLRDLAMPDQRGSLMSESRQRTPLRVMTNTTGCRALVSTVAVKRDIDS